MKNLAIKNLVIQSPIIKNLNLVIKIYELIYWDLSPY